MDSLARWWPWPWTLANGIASLVFVAGVVRAWRSAERVVKENRRRTRVWRVIVAVSITLWIAGVWIPVGAIYALGVYKRPTGAVSARSRAATSA